MSVSFLALTLLVAAAAGGPLPRMTASRLPVPPAQHRPWSVPDDAAPPELLSATKVLFEQGLADRIPLQDTVDQLIEQNQELSEDSA